MGWIVLKLVLTVLALLGFGCFCFVCGLIHGMRCGFMPDIEDVEL